MTNYSDVRIFLCTTPTDMHYSFDRLLGRTREIFEQDPLDGHLFLFVNRNRDRLKLLFWDRDGFCIFYKRHESKCPLFLLCTRIGERADNLARWLVAASGMDASTAICGPRRWFMHSDVTLVAPPLRPPADVPAAPDPLWRLLTDEQRRQTLSTLSRIVLRQLDAPRNESEVCHE